MHSSRKSLIWTAILAFGLTFAGSALGSGLVIGSGSVDFATKAGRSGEVSVVGPSGYQFHHSFEAGEGATMSLYDADGGLIPDGTYKWEISYDGAASGDRSDFTGRGERLSGVFTVANGSVADPNRLESLPTKDQQILDDLIVDGSACIGQDCVNGESFGFDTIRIKENNLRIKAQDTSSTASFPTQDWQLTFNDSTNGGANKFSIDCVSPGSSTPFTVEGCAPSHSLYVDDGGRIGFGTNTPVADLHVKSGNTPTLRLDQDGSSGFGAQVWDVAGNEANFFIRDASNGSTLPFRIRPGAPTSAFDMAGDGDIGIGTSSPGTLSDAGGTNASIHIRRTDGDASLFIEENSSTVSSRLMMELENNGDIFYRMRNTDSGNFMDINFTANEFRINLASTTGSDLELDANGNLSIDGSLTTGTATVYPDYVFEADYPLMPLDKLETFIAENGHLPNVPSEEETAGRINMSEMQLKLLEKVEELTLYTLEQERALQELRARLNELEPSEQE